jgi:hypothetical protein
MSTIKVVVESFAKWQPRCDRRISKIAAIGKGSPQEVPAGMPHNVGPRCAEKDKGMQHLQMGKKMETEAASTLAACGGRGSVGNGWRVRAG